MGDDLRQVYSMDKVIFLFPKVTERFLGDTVHVEAYMEPLAGG